MNLGKQLLVAVGGMALAVSAQAALTGRWDFDSGNLNGAVGGALTYRDGDGGPTQSGTAFGTTTSFGVPNIGGQEAKVMKFAGGPDDTGYLVPSPANGNGGGQFVNEFTVLMDVLWPASSSSKLRALIEAGRDVNPDAEVFVLANNSVGIKGTGFGALNADTWYRLGVVSKVVNPDAGVVQLTFYVNGALVGSVSGANLLDQRFALAAGGTFELFSDDTAEVAPGFLNSLQVYDTALSKGQVLALGEPTAAGLPSTLPPVPSFAEKWIPSGSFASRSTKVGIVLDPGSTTIQDNSIQLQLDGVALASPTISRANGLITVEKAPAAALTLGKHVLTVTYTDSLAGQKTLTREFSAVLLFEDFESIALAPAKDETGGVTVTILEGWTNRPPVGWSIDNSDFPAVVISAENPDDDGDGFADNDGRTEWAGWSFATKEFWVSSDNQTRDQFNLAEGTVAIADPDEWDDVGHFVSLFNSYLTTPPISLEGIAPNTAFVSFASSWRPEGYDDNNASKFPVGPEGEAINNQTAIVTASFDGGEPVQLLKYDSKDGSPTFKADAQNESVLLQLKNPAGAKSVVLSFELRDGANDWWWAVDNIAVGAGAAPPTIDQEPVALEVTEGAAAELKVVSGGSGLSYQWFKGLGAARTAVAGATADTLAFAKAAVGDTGYYSVDVKNAEGTASSKFAKLSVLPKTEGRLVLLTEDFEGLVLGPNVDETVVGEAVWTKTPPTGWTIDDTGVPGVESGNDGVTEWAGWSFAKREWWAEAGGQNRDKFVKGVGTVAIGDSDEWDDAGHDAGNMATYITTKTISLTGAKANSVIVKYDSSWNPEEPQTANVTVSFDGGAEIEIKRYESAPANPKYHPAELSETLAFAVNNPSGAKTMTVKFGYFNTLNNWWFAFDNLQVLADPAPLYFEDFEGVVLGPNVEEGIITGSGGAQTAVWSKTGPAGWTVDNSGVPGVGTDQDGVTEWAGWSFAKREWWAATAGDQDRTKFLKGVGTVAIADSDEWDDVAHATGNMATFLKTPAIDITGKAANTLYLKFDSSWRDEDPQKATVTASFDGGAPVEVLRWVSDPASPSFHDDSVDETVTLPIYNPAGAKSVALTFGYFDTRNNWWWAIDNVELSVGDVAPPAGPVVNGDPKIPGLLGGAFTEVQVDTATKTISAKLPASGDAGYMSIAPGVKVLSVQIQGDRLVVKYQ